MAGWNTPHYNEDHLLDPVQMGPEPVSLLEPLWQHVYQAEHGQQAPPIASSHHHHLPQHNSYTEHTQYDQGLTRHSPNRPPLNTWPIVSQCDNITSHNPPTPISPFNCLGNEVVNSSISSCPPSSSSETWSADPSLHAGHHPVSPDMTRLSTAAPSRRGSAPTPTNFSPTPQGSYHYPGSAYDAVEPEPISSAPRATRSLPMNFPSHFSHISSGPRWASSAHNLAVDRIQRNANLSRRSSMQSLSRAQSPNRLRIPHNLVERRYRDNLNNQIESLRLALPSLRDARPAVPLSSVPSPGREDVSMTMLPRMPSKAVIISTAASYIRDLEAEREQLLAANRDLQDQVCDLQKSIRFDDSSVLSHFSKMHGGFGAPPSAPSSSS